MVTRDSVDKIGWQTLFLTRGLGGEGTGGEEKEEKWAISRSFAPFAPGSRALGAVELASFPNFNASITASLPVRHCITVSLRQSPNKSNANPTWSKPAFFGSCESDKCDGWDAYEFFPRVFIGDECDESQADECSNNLV